MEQLGKDHLDQLAEEPYFVDFLRDPPEPTGEEPEDANLDAPKINELVIKKIIFTYSLSLVYKLFLFNYILFLTSPLIHRGL